MYNYLIITVILLAGAAWSIKAGKLTVAGAVTGALIGLLQFIASGYVALAMMTAFFMLGTIATSWKKRYKEQLGLTEENKGRRTAGQVLANSGLAAVLALLAIIFPHLSGVFALMIAASFSAATADTLSSELGNVYGKQYYNITTFKAGERGLDGVISFEGTFAGVLGSLVIAIIFSIGFGCDLKLFLTIVIAGTIGNLADSYLGATAERKGYLNNNSVNFLNTLIGAVAGFFIIKLF